jgi:outer membrane lipoprotein-sorting protein
MKKIFAWTMAAAVLVSLAALPGYGQTAQDIVKKMIDAQGGRTYLESIKDTTITGTMELPSMGMTGSFTEYRKEPNKWRMDAEIMGMVMTQAYDGQKAWSTNMQTGQVEESPEPQAKEFARQAIGNGGLLTPEKFGITYTAKPKAKLEDKEYFVLEQKMADGHLTTIYIDPVTYLPYKTEGMGLGPTGADAKTESYTTDYKKVGQSMVPHSIRQVIDGTEFVKITITKIVFNTNVDDSLFALGK